MVDSANFKSHHPELFWRNDVLKNFAKFISGVSIVEFEKYAGCVRMESSKLPTKCQHNVNGVVLVSSLLTLHICGSFFSVYMVDFEQVNVFSGFTRN